MVNCIFVWECSGRDASSRPSLSCDQLDQCPTKLVILQLFLLGLLVVHLHDDQAHAHLVVLNLPNSLSFSARWPVRGMPNQTCISSCTLLVLISPDLEADQATVFNPLSYSRALHKVNVSTFGAWRSSHHQFSYFTAVTQSLGHRVKCVHIWSWAAVRLRSSFPPSVLLLDCYPVMPPNLTCGDRLKVNRSFLGISLVALFLISESTKSLALLFVGPPLPEPHKAGQSILT